MSTYWHKYIILACQAPFNSVLTKPWPPEPDIDYNSNDRPVTVSKWNLTTRTDGHIKCDNSANKMWQNIFARLYGALAALYIDHSEKSRRQRGTKSVHYLRHQAYSGNAVTYDRWLYCLGWLRVLMTQIVDRLKFHCTALLFGKVYIPTLHYLTLWANKETF